MKRREFLGTLGASAVAFTLPSAKAQQGSMSSLPQLAITLDDFNLFDTPTMTAGDRNRKILDALKAENLKAALFVAGRYVDSEQKRAYLKEWNDSDHIIGNHSFSHLYYPDTSFAEFSADLLRGEKIVKDFPRFKKLFRFPYLKEGDTAGKRDGMRAFLHEHEYHNGHVTIDASDWYVDGRLRQKLKQHPNIDLAPYRNFYLAHLWERSVYYDHLAQRVTRRRVKHTLLLHHNLLNGLFLGDALRMFKARGWQLIDADIAFADPIFASVPETLPAGESLIWALAKQTGRFDKALRYPGEDGIYEKPKMDKMNL